jgi:hypothetical protein
LNEKGGPKEKRIGEFKLNETFSGYQFKTLPNGSTLWAVQGPSDKNASGYVYQSPKKHKIVKA